MKHTPPGHRIRFRSYWLFARRNFFVRNRSTTFRAPRFPPSPMSTMRHFRRDDSASRALYIHRYCMQLLPAACTFKVPHRIAGTVGVSCAAAPRPERDDIAREITSSSESCSRDRVLERNCERFWSLAERRGRTGGNSYGPYYVSVCRNNISETARSRRRRRRNSSAVNAPASRDDRDSSRRRRISLRIVRRQTNRRDFVADRTGRNNSAVCVIACTRITNSSAGARAQDIYIYIYI